MNQVIEFFTKLFEYGDWPPQWHSGKWSEFHGWLYIISDLLIWSAYFTIPLIIIKYITRKRNPEFLKLYFLFTAFILASGATHFLDAVSFWFPLYRLNALLQLLTGVISWITVLYVIRHFTLDFVVRSQKTLEKEIDRRNKIENELRDSEEQIQTIYKNAPDAVIVISSKGNVVKWNPAAEKMLGWKEEEALGKVLNELIVPEEDRQAHIAEMKNFLKTGESHVLNRTTLQTVLRKNNSTLIVEFTVSPVKIKDDYLFIGYVNILCIGIFNGIIELFLYNAVNSKL